MSPDRRESRRIALFALIGVPLLGAPVGGVLWTLLAVFDLRGTYGVQWWPLLRHSLYVAYWISVVLGPACAALIMLAPGDEST